MNTRIPGLDGDAAEKLASLVKRPRHVELISITDGSSFSFQDDGASIGDSGVQPNGRRAQLEAVANKRLYIDGENVPAYYTAKKIPGIWPGDPLAQIPVFGAEAKKLCEELKAKRTVTQKAGAEAMIADRVKKPAK